MAKKKITSRVNPPIKKSDEKFERYGDLEDGDAFIMNGALWVKINTCDQEALNLDNGRYEDCLCEQIVIPVDITINWKRKT